MFQTELGNTVPALSAENYLKIITALKSNTGLSQRQIEEAASFSMAMVLRVALGLDAKDANLAVLVNESESGAIAIATARQLQNAGCDVKIVFVGDVDLESDFYQDQLKYHEYSQTECFIWNRLEQNQEFNELLALQHAVLLGLFKFDQVDNSEFQNKLVELLNESNVPCHTIFAPLGFNSKTSEKSGTRLIASSTLSLGLPLEILSKIPDFIGRHYLCDISLLKKITQEIGVELPILFSEQPVIQIFPPKSEL